MSADPFLGEIQLFPYNFAPRGWAFCNGQILPISQNTALFSLLGTTYGGNGQTTFALPDLRGRVPVSSGQGPGLSPYDLGEQGGVETVTLTPGQLPPHSHDVHASDAAGSFDGPTENFPAALSSNAYRNDTNTTMNPQMVTGGGGGQPHENRQPYLTLNYCIALEGIFPSRN